MWPFDQLFTPAKPNPIEEVNEKDTQGLLCLECGQTPQELISVEGLYYCQSCLDANTRRERWESEEAEWSAKDKDNPPKD
jgi:hypothetical protein